MAVTDDRARVWLIAPLACVCVAFGLATRAWLTVAFLLVASIPSLWLKQRPSWSPRVQLLTGGAVAAIALLLGPAGAPDVVFPPGGTASLHPLAVRLALAILAVSVLRRFLRAPAGGAPASLVALTAALAACGYAPWNSAYAVLVAAFVVASIPVLRSSPGGGPAWQSLDLRRKAAVAVMLLLTMVCAAGLSTAIPLLHRQFIAAFLRYDGGRSESGLTDSILLGGSIDIMESDEVVLRVQGGEADYLRGFVLSRYRNGAWLPGEGDPGRATALGSTPGQDTGMIEIRAAKSSPRFYLPLHAAHVRAGSGTVIADKMGLIHSPSGTAAEVAWFDPGERDRWPVAQPAEEDLAVPDGIRPALQRVVEEWTAGARSPREKLKAIENRLQRDFRYSLQSEHRTNADPVLDFLLRHRVGHCEYFASAMALLSRASGVPARVISGYRVVERNPFGGYDVVRERDAHAWVEAWIEGEGWTTFDPTPPSALAALRSSRTPLFGGLADLAWDLWGRAERSEAARPRNLAGGMAIGLVIAGAAVWWKRRIRGGKRRTRSTSESESTCFPLLAGALATGGYVRAESETLEAFAARIRKSAPDNPLALQGSVLVEDYARIRYGGIGDLQELEERIRALGGARDGEHHI